MKTSNKLAIISVWDKAGVEQFARALQSRGVDILSTGGTAHMLKDAGIDVMSISDYTGSPEILSGRVKSLHPKIHGGILARRGNSDDMAQIDKEGIRPIDFVIVNLYPFTKEIERIYSTQDKGHGSLVELIDIGGPTMIRAAAKNCACVVPVCDPNDYQVILDELDEKGDISLRTRKRLAAKVFATMSAYDAEVARYFSLNEELYDLDGNKQLFAPYEAIVLEKQQSLRYGENPHQSASFYRRFVNTDAHNSADLWKILQGKELSYNNLVDAHAALDLFLDLYDHSESKHCAVVIKHTNPCGVAIRDTAIEAFRVARACDPDSAFGGIIAVSGVVDVPLAQLILENFVEVVLVRDVTMDALKIFQKKKNVRLVKCQFEQMMSDLSRYCVQYRPVMGGYLVQTPDVISEDLNEANVVTCPAQVPMLLNEFQLAWKVCKHVKSNAIVIAKNGQVIGVGAGQMSRVDAARIAIERAKLHGHDINGAVAASDAFLPFADTLEVLTEAGVVGLVQPGGSLKDQDVIAVAESRKVAMVFVGNRHFRH